MKRIFNALAVLIAVGLYLAFSGSAVCAEGAQSMVYTVTSHGEDYSLRCEGVEISCGDDLSQVLDAVPKVGFAEVYFDTVSTSDSITFYGGEITLSGVLNLVGGAFVTVDDAHLLIKGAAVSFDTGAFRVKRGELKITGGSVTSHSVAILSDFSASASVKIAGGSIVSDSDTAVRIERGSISVSGGSVSGADAAIIANTTLTLSGSPELFGREYDIVTGTEITLFSDGSLFRGSARVKLLSEFPYGRTTVAVYAKAAESLFGITLFDINGIMHTLTFLDSVSSGVGESVGAVLLPYTVTFYSGEELISSSEYIKGSRLEMPSPTDRRGYSFVGWCTADGDLFDPNLEIASDISLYASYTLSAPTYTVISPSFVYDGGCHQVEIRDLYHPLIESGFISFVWYKDGVQLNSFGSSHSVITVADSGAYTVVITLTVGKDSVSVTSAPADVVITKKGIAIPAIPTVKYTGFPILADISNTQEYTVSQAVGTIVGAYPVEITLIDSENYCFIGADSPSVYVDFVIERGINKWITPLTVADIYTGQVPDPTAEALFGKVEILYRRADDTYLFAGAPSAAGEYVARAFVAGTENYTSLEGAEVSFRIITERVEGISVVQSPHKQVYSAFECFIADGIEVLAMYNSGRLESVGPENLSFMYQTADSFRYGDSGITVSFGGKSVTLSLTIERAEYDLSSVVFTSVSLPYSGTLVSAPVPKDLPIGLDGIPLVGAVNGGGTLVGEYSVTLEFSTESRNYKIPSAISATLTVTPCYVEAVWSELSFVYDGTDKLPMAFYKDVFGRRIMLDVIGARSFAGEYTASACNTDPNYSVINSECSFVIAKADYDMSGVSWCGGSEYYDGTEKSVYISNLPSGVSVVGYVNNRATSSGDYTARASLSYDSNNYNPPIIPEYTWQILKLDYQTGGFLFPDAEYVYDKMPHYPSLVGEMPVGIDGIALKYEFSHGVVNVREGRAAVTVSFITESRDYNVPESITAYVTVLPRDINVSWSGLFATYSGAYILPIATSSECSITVSGGGIGAGEYTSYAVSDDPNYRVSNSVAHLVILRAENRWIVQPTVGDIFYGRAPTPFAEARAGAVKFTYYSVSDTDAPLYDVPRAVGEYYVIASTDGDDNHLPMASDPLYFSIIAVVPIGLDVRLQRTEFVALEKVGDDDISVYLAYNDGTRRAIGLDMLTITYPCMDVFLFGDSELTVEYAGYSVTCSVTVYRADYDLSSVSWMMADTVYDGSFKCAYLSGLPEGISVLEYIGGGVCAGEYYVSAQLSYDTVNYNPPIIDGVLMKVEKMLVPTPDVPSCEYNGLTVFPDLSNTSLYTVNVTGGKYPGSYPTVFTLLDSENYTFSSGGSVIVDFVIEPRRLIVEVGSVKVNLLEQIPEFSFALISGELLSGDVLEPTYTVIDGRIYAEFYMPNYLITVVPGELVRTNRFSPLAAIVMTVLLFALLASLTVIILFVRRFRRAALSRRALLAVKLDDMWVTEDEIDKNDEKAGQNVNPIATSDGAITAEYAEKTISNELAKDLIRREAQVSTDGWRRGIINVDTLSESFSSGERVDINILKRKSLIPYDTAYIRVLARGAIDKPLYVYANDFSLSAVKMIALAGGRSIKVSGRFISNPTENKGFDK